MTITTKMQLADNLAAAIADGGATMSTTDGSPIRNGYTIGGGILKTADALATFPISLGERAIRNGIYLELLKSGEELKEFEAVGIWVSNGVVYLDAVTVESNFIKAVVTGLTRKQQAIGSLKGGQYEEIGLKTEATATRKEAAMSTKESGFSLIELVAALAISSILGLVGITTLTPLIGQFEERAAAIEQQQADQQAELEWYLDSIAN